MVVNGKLKNHAFYHEISSYQHQYHDLEDRYDLFLYGYTLHLDFYQGRGEYLEAVTLFHIEDIGSDISAFVRHWELREPNRIFNLELTGICSVYRFNYTSSQNGILYNKISGALDGRDFLMELSEMLPLKNVRITIQCPNKNNHFFFIYPQAEDPDQKDDLLIGDPEFDKTFILQASNNNVLEQVLTADVQNRIMDCYGLSRLTIGFGNYVKVVDKPPETSKYTLSDQEDVLDFQLLQHKGERTTQTENTDAEDTGNTNQFVFEAKPTQRMQFNLLLLSKFVEVCVDCTRQMAKRIAEI